MLIDGSGEWVYNATEDDWNWEGEIANGFSKAAWHWAERSQSIKDKLTAAGVQFDTFTLDQAGNLWSFNESAPYFACADPDIRVMQAGGPWAKSQGMYLAMSRVAVLLTTVPQSVFYFIFQRSFPDFELSFLNSKRTSKSNATTVVITNVQSIHTTCCSFPFCFPFQNFLIKMFAILPQKTTNT